MTNKDEYLNFATIKTNADIPAVLTDFGIFDSLEPIKDELVGQCPVGGAHGKADSFSFNIRKGSFQCFACKKRGSILDFAQAMLGDVSLREAALHVQSIMDQQENEPEENPVEETPKQDAKPTAKNTPPTLPDQPITPANLQHAVMPWSLAQYRVQEGKLNPDELVVVDVTSLEFMRQLVS